MTEVPAVTLLNDWPHISRKWKEGHFAKKMRNQEKNGGLVQSMLYDLRMAPTRAAFDGLKTKFKDVLYYLEEEAFADYFIKTYLTEPWDSWFIGASPAGVGACGQQLIENSHRGDKAMLGKNALRASPREFLTSSLPLILLRASDTLQKHPVHKVSHRGEAPITPQLVADAQRMVENQQQQHLRVDDDDDGNQYFVVNLGLDKEKRPMTKKRAKAFSEYYDFGTVPSSTTPDKDHYKAMSDDVLKASMVSAKKVNSRDALAPWAANAGNMYAPDEHGQLWDLDCSCYEYSHSNNVCRCVVYMAAQLNFVDLGALLGGTAPRRGAGRPRKDKGWSDTSGGAAKKKTSSQWLREIRNSQTMRLWRFNVLLDVDGEKLVGYVKSVREVVAGEASSREFTIVFHDEPDQTTVISDTALAQGVVDAREAGITQVYQRQEPAAP